MCDHDPQAPTGPLPPLQLGTWVRDSPLSVLRRLPPFYLALYPSSSPSFRDVFEGPSYLLCAMDNGVHNRKSWPRNSTAKQPVWASFAWRCMPMSSQFPACNNTRDCWTLTEVLAIQIFVGWRSWRLLLPAAKTTKNTGQSSQAGSTGYHHLPWPNTTPPGTEVGRCTTFQWTDCVMHLVGVPHLLPKALCFIQCQGTWFIVTYIYQNELTCSSLFMVMRQDSVKYST